MILEFLMVKTVPATGWLFYDIQLMTSMYSLDFILWFAPTISSKVLYVHFEPCP